jgi:predicted DNA-binding transcriptional regulator YafY
MSRSARLLDLIQLLRRHRQPVSGQALAADLGVSIRTLYRDVASLQAQGAHIEGEPGVGYVLRPGFMLPPLMFSEEEIEALVLGSRWVADRTDHRLGSAARNALAKIAAVLPDDLRQSLDSSTLLVGPGPKADTLGVDLSAIRKAIRTEHVLFIAYTDKTGQISDRFIWPFALGYFEKVLVVIAWCETRQDFRHFRTDRIGRLDVTDIRYPKRRAALMKEWRKSENISEGQK